MVEYQVSGGARERQAVSAGNYSKLSGFKPR